MGTGRWEGRIRGEVTWGRGRVEESEGKRHGEWDVRRDLKEEDKGKGT